ncbi:unnamed protein product, partial [Allacma fusca]
MVADRLTYAGADSLLLQG